VIKITDYTYARGDTTALRKVDVNHINDLITFHKNNNLPAPGWMDVNNPETYGLMMNDDYAVDDDLSRIVECDGPHSIFLEDPNNQTPSQWGQDWEVIVRDNKTGDMFTIAGSDCGTYFQGVIDEDTPSGASDKAKYLKSLQSFHPNVTKLIQVVD